MITVKQWRDRDGEHFDQGTDQRTVEDALERLVIYELGYGGRITDLDYSEDEQGGSAMVKVETQVLNCHDTMVMTGTAKDMGLIVQVAALANQHHGFSEESMDRTLNDIMEFTKGNPLLVKMGGDMIAGRHTIRNICIALMGGQEYVAMLSKLPMKDMLAALMMVHNGECTLNEAVELAA